MKQFPTLYSRSTTGAVMKWDISVELDTQTNLQAGLITIKWGQEDGAIQTTTDLIVAGKNLGKKNETSPLQQAELEAESKWTYKQEREGYVTDRSKIDEDQRIGVEPMLAQRYDKHPDKIEFPCFVQPKLDGHRCLAVIDAEKCTLFSRNRTLITGVPHINQVLFETYGGMVPKTGIFVLDGELYNHEYKDEFEALSSFIRSQDPKDGYQAVQYHVYDIVETSMPFFLRHEVLRALATAYHARVIPDTTLQFVETIIAEQDQVTSVFRRFRSLGYEGAMLRNRDTLYEQKRSYGLQKVKEFEDDEFKIVGIKEGKGKLRGHAIFICALDETSTDTVDVKLKGEESKLKEIYENQSAYLGRTLTVQFQGRTKDNSLRFPVGLRLRENI